MEDYLSLSDRRYPSPSAQRRSGEHWKARLGLAVVVLMTLCTAAVLFRVAGLGVGAAISPLMGGVVRPTQAPAPTAPAGQPAGQPSGQPVAPGATVPKPVPPTATAAPPAPSATPANRREYVVVSGDSLSSIAQRNNTTIDALVAANNLASRNVVLNVGQRLIIP